MKLKEKCPRGRQRSKWEQQVECHIEGRTQKETENEKPWEKKDNWQGLVARVVYDSIIW
jgi:hypothetical protein